MDLLTAFCAFMPTSVLTGVGHFNLELSIMKRLIISTIAIIISCYVVIIMVRIWG